MEKSSMNDSLGALLSKANWHIRTHLYNQLRKNGFNITPEQWSVIMIVMNNPGISQTGIAQIAFKDKTVITRILDVLEKNNFVSRENDARDRRVYRIHLTEHAQNMLEKLFPIAIQVNQDSSQDISNDELILLKNNLKTICKTLKKFIDNENKTN